MNHILEDKETNMKETLSPYKFEIFQTVEQVPPQLRVYLNTPFDPTIPVKCWIDQTQYASDIEFITYKVLKTNANGGFAWDAHTNSPQFKTIFVPLEMVGRFNIPPKDFAGKFQEVPTIGEWPCPVETSPPEGYEWFNSMGLIPTFRLKAMTPITLEMIYAEVKALKASFDEFRKR